MALFGCGHLGKQQELAKLRASQLERYRAALQQATANAANTTKQHLNKKELAQGSGENSDSPCHEFTLLSQEPQFALAEAARLRALLYCPRMLELDFRWQQASQLAKEKPYLRDLIWPAAERVALLRQNNLDLIKIWLAQARTSSQTSEKETILRRALALSTALGQRELESTARSQLWQVAPRLQPKPARAQWFKVANDFRQARQFEPAAEYYQRIIAEPAVVWQEKLRAYLGLRSALKAQGQSAQVIATLERAQTWLARLWKKSPANRELTTQYHDTALMRLRAEWTSGDVVSARLELGRLEKRLRARHPLNEIYWLQGRIEEENGRLENAYDWYLKAEKDLAAAAENPSLRDKIYWGKAWTLYKQNKFSEAAKAFATLKGSSQTPFDRARASFWLARSLLSSNAKQTAAGEAQKEFRELASFDPVGYYGLAAAQALGLSVSAPKTAEPEPKSIEQFDTIDWFVEAGESGVALNLLAPLAQKLLRTQLAQGPTKSEWLSLFTNYLRSNNAAAAFSLLSQLEPNYRHNLFSKNWPLFFPEPFGELVARASREQGVPAELIYAIMRQESSFDSQARSPADAFGLMQIIPAAAEPLAQKLQLSSLAYQNLFDPEINVAIGAALLGDLLARYKNDLIPAIASYNASELSVRNWLKNRHRADPMEFIEEIPFEETRGYVRLVLRNYFCYLLKNNRVIGNDRFRLKSAKAGSLQNRNDASLQLLVGNR